MPSFYTNVKHKGDIEEVINILQEGKPIVKILVILFFVGLSLVISNFIHR